MNIISFGNSCFPSSLSILILFAPQVENVNCVHFSMEAILRGDETGNKLAWAGKFVVLIQ